LLQCTSVFPRTREYFYGHAMSWYPLKYIMHCHDVHTETSRCS
jgi:hypothetical protein